MKKKFRVWDRKRREWINANFICSFLLDGSLIANSLKETRDGDFIICQYTGLKDKNDQEIWEGDILLCIDVPLEFYGEVKYDPPCFRILTPNGNDALICAEFYEKFEAVGNIFENPELLEKNMPQCSSKEHLDWIDQKIKKRKRSKIGL